MRYLLIFAFLLPSVWGIAQSTTKEMVNALRESATQGVMYGHHDDTMYGYRWKDENGERSDTKDVVDMYPAMMSFELCRLEKGLERNIDGVSFDKMHAVGMRTTSSRERMRGMCRIAAWCRVSCLVVRKPTSFWSGWIVWLLSSCR